MRHAGAVANAGPRPSQLLLGGILVLVGCSEPGPDVRVVDWGTIDCRAPIPAGQTKTFRCSAPITARLSGFGDPLANVRGRITSAVGGFGDMGVSVFGELNDFTPESDEVIVSAVLEGTVAADVACEPGVDPEGRVSFFVVEDADENEVSDERSGVEVSVSCT